MPRVIIVQNQQKSGKLKPSTGNLKCMKISPVGTPVHTDSCNHRRLILSMMKFKCAAAKRQLFSIAVNGHR
jgi:hypothetical protein